MVKKVIISIIINIICWGIYILSVFIPYGKEIITMLENSLNENTEWDLGLILLKLAAMFGYAMLVSLSIFILQLLIIPRE